MVRGQWRLAERELASGRLVAPFAEIVNDIRYIGLWLVFPPDKARLPALTKFAAQLNAELPFESARPPA